MIEIDRSQLKGETLVSVDFKADPLEVLEKVNKELEGYCMEIVRVKDDSDSISFFIRR